MAELIGRDPSVEGLANVIATRAGGVPLFMEEVVGALRQDGRDRPVRVAGREAVASQQKRPLTGPRVTISPS